MDTVKGKAAKGTLTTTKKKYASWSKSSEADGVTKRINVEEIENGYIVRLSEYGRVSSDNYLDNNRTFYSETNPLEGDDMALDAGLDEAITNFVNSI